MELYARIDKDYIRQEAVRPTANMSVCSNKALYCLGPLVRGKAFCGKICTPGHCWLQHVLAVVFVNYASFLCLLCSKQHGIH